MNRLKLLLLLGWIGAGCTGSSLFTGGTGDLDWHLFRGDASLSGYTAVELPAQPTLLWTFKGGSRTVSSPVVDQGTTYWCDNRGRLRGVDLQGNPVFDYDLKTAVEATPMISDSILYIGRIDGNMSALSLARKDTVWHYETWGQVSASPNSLRFEGRQAVVFGSYDNFLYCVDSRTGALISRFETGYYLNGAVALWGDYVLFGGCDAWLRVINCKTGVPADSLQLDAYVPASPAIMGNYGYVGDYSGNIYEIYLDKGKIARHRIIRAAGGDEGGFISVPALTMDRVYVLSNDRHVYAINRKNGHIDWKYLLKGTVGESSPVVAGDRMVVCTKSGIVSILDAAKGTLEWEYDTGEQIVGSPAVIRDHLLVLTAKGTLFCFGNNKRK